MPPVPERPTSWQTFLRAHWGAIAGADFFTTEVWTWRGLVTYYTVFVIDLASRRVQILGSTPHPEALFMQQIVRTLTMAEAGAVPAPNVLTCDGIGSGAVTCGVDLGTRGSTWFSFSSVRPMRTPMRNGSCGRLRKNAWTG